MGRKKNLEAIRARISDLKESVTYWEGHKYPNFELLDKHADELEALEWALKKLEAEEIGISDRVKLFIYEGEDSEQPEYGEVIGYAASGFLIRPLSGPYSGTKLGLWYSTDHVTLIDE